MCVPQPTKGSCICSSLWGCLSFSQWETKFTATALLSTCFISYCIPSPHRCNASPKPVLLSPQDCCCSSTSQPDHTSFYLHLPAFLSCTRAGNPHLHAAQSSPSIADMMLQAHSLLHIQSHSFLPSKHHSHSLEQWQGRLKPCS